jgi:hypothetical protein
MWEVFPSVGSLPVHWKSFHVCEAFPHTRRLPTYGRFPIYGESAHIWNKS